MMSTGRPNKETGKGWMNNSESTAGEKLSSDAVSPNTHLPIVKIQLLAGPDILQTTKVTPVFVIHAWVGLDACTVPPKRSRVATFFVVFVKVVFLILVLLLWGLGRSGTRRNITC